MFDFSSILEDLDQVLDRFDNVEMELENVSNGHIQDLFEVLGEFLDHDLIFVMTTLQNIRSKLGDVVGFEEVEEDVLEEESESR